MSLDVPFSALRRQPVPRLVLSPRRILSDMLSKGWIESLIPFVALVCVAAGVLLTTDGYFAASNLRNLAQYATDGGLVVLALLIVVAVGGIDLSVGSNFAMSAFVALFCFHILQLPVPVVLLAALASGALVGVVNGVVAGLMGCGALLTTLGTMITMRGLYTLGSQAWLVEISGSARMDDLWDFIGFEKVLTLPVGFWALVAVVAIVFVMFRQSRFGWHVLAVGGNRKAARHGGIRVRTTVFLAYVCAGFLVGLAGFFFAARQNSIGSDTGIGLELFALTALVVGLGGFVPGRGAVMSVLIGFATIYILNNAMVNGGFRGDFVQFSLGAIILAILAIDVKFRKNRHRLLASSYLDPATYDPGPVKGMDGLMPDETVPKLARADILVAGQVDGPEDVLLDRDGNIYCGSRDGYLYRIPGPDHDSAEVLAKIGGRPLGLALDAENRIVVCVAGMGLVRVTMAGEVELLTYETERSLFSLRDDTAIRMADDLDIAPDGTIFFTDATKRYDIDDWGLDLLEGRPNGRLLSYDPKTRRTRTVCDNLRFPNGVCLTHDGKHLLVASTWECSILIFDLDRLSDGPRVFADGLPGYPDNVNRALDGSYWVALAGMRNPVFDLAMRHPDMRRRMARSVPPTNWLFGNLNVGGVLKVDAKGQVADALWDAPDGPLYMITSMREHEGALYLGGVTNNKIGRLGVAGADACWRGPDSYWGAAR
ncbi:ABC transporter permease [Aureimonas jatrophae]|uniref:Monosaccharide ABC transporter membrane protein, CUT2 family n=1 Tax=Aureimonas jatrophae TaxID=1166073 RepID=A0A1H0KCK5_9HYPH|nr:SMP-30/gluconolactonase/LRE family protein [Aureimonas jatrophae]MBB3951064.1 ribose transport system permease protein [Aureimonas jatrophae]SDO53695.1 monosaccharide ABC transporter membrane protein, CUT2 family [Aureimonas jatrophae]